MKRKLILGATLLSTLFGVFWLSGYGFLSITVPGHANDELSISIRRQDGKPDETIVKGGEFKRLVRKGLYQAVVKNSKESFVAVQPVGGFFSTSKVGARLSPEQARQFVGNDPLPCAYYVASVLMSTACGDAIYKLQLHVPASVNRPTYTEPIPAPLSGYIEGLVTTSEGSFVLENTPSYFDSEKAPHTLYRIDASGNVSGERALNELDGKQIYKLAPHQKGFIAFTAKTNKAIYYPSATSASQTIELKKPADDLSLFALVTYEGKVAAVYSTAELPESEGLGEPGSGKAELATRRGLIQKPRTIVTIGSANTSSSFNFNFEAITVKLCAATRLCVLVPDGLQVYDIGGKTAKLLYALSGVVDIEQSASGLLAVTDTGVIRFNPITNQGYFEYVFGEYDFCGIQGIYAGYVLCVGDQDGTRALHINQSSVDADMIDKKVFELKKINEVSEVSAYGSYIFVSPELGPLEYDSSIRGYRYNQSKINTANSAINEAIKRLNIDQSKFIVKSTYQ